jgi:Rrf2 family protein
MVFLAAQESSAPVTTKKMASIMDVSENHLSKVMQRLVKSGLAEARRGPKGGVSIAGDPHKITLLMVYEAIDGRLNISPCLLTTNLCKPGECIFGDLIHSVGRQMKNHLSENSVADVAYVFADHKISGHKTAELKSASA